MIIISNGCNCAHFRVSHKNFASTFFSSINYLIVQRHYTCEQSTSRDAVLSFTRLQLQIEASVGNHGFFAVTASSRIYSLSVSTSSSLSCSLNCLIMWEPINQHFTMPSVSGLGFWPSPFEAGRSCHLRMSSSSTMSS